MASYEAYLGVGIDASGAQQGAAQVNAAMEKMAAAAKKAAKETAYYEQQLDKTMFAVKAFAAAAGALAIREITNYTQAMSNARAMTQASAEEMKDLDKIVRDLGASTSFSASQVAEAAAILGQAGFSIKDMATALPATLDLAAAATIGMGEAAQITANVMAGFQLETKDLSKAADILAAVSVASTADISGLGEAMKYAGPTATKLGISLEETAAYMAVLAQNGLYAGQAGRQFNSAIFSLLKPSKEAEKVIKGLGLSLKDVNPQFTKFDEIMRKLADSGADATAISQIFGAGGFGVITALTSNLPMMEKMVGVTTDAAGTTKRISEIKLDNLAGDFEQLTGALSELALKTGDAGAEGAMRKFVQAATEGVDWLSKLAVEAAKSKDTFWLLQSSVELLAFSVGSLVTVQLAAWIIGVSKAMYAAYAASALFGTTLGLLPISAIVASLAILSLSIYKIATNWNYVGEVAMDVLDDMVFYTKRAFAAMYIIVKGFFDGAISGAKTLKDLMINIGEQVWFNLSKQTDKATAAQQRFQVILQNHWKALLPLTSGFNAELDRMVAPRQNWWAPMKDGVVNMISSVKSASKGLWGDLEKLLPAASAAGDVKPKGGGGGSTETKKEPMMEAELRNMSLAVTLAKNLGAAESELYRIRLNAQALQEAKENKQKGISAATQKQIEQAVALQAEETKLTTVYEARKGLDDNLKARLKTAMEAVSVAQNMGASEADLLRMQLESQASEAARKMGLKGLTDEMQKMIDKIVTLTGLSAEYKKAYENDKQKKDYIQGLKDQLAEEQKRAELMKQYKNNIAEVDTQMKIYNETKQKKVDLTTEEIKQAANIVNEEKKVAAQTAATAEAAKKASESQKQWNNQLTYAFKDAIMNSKNLGDALSNLANRVQDMLVNKALDSLLGGMFASMKFAKGAAFQAGGVTAFASGGVVNSPTMFPMRGGVGLMGEAGAEAIMPLTRTSSGDLGVKAVGGGSTVIAPNITINVSGGTKEQNDDAGRKVSTAVKQAIDDTVISVILREKRPGGVLNAA